MTLDEARELGLDLGPDIEEALEIGLEIDVEGALDHAKGVSDDDNL